MKFTFNFSEPVVTAYLTDIYGGEIEIVENQEHDELPCEMWVQIPEGYEFDGVPYVSYSDVYGNNDSIDLPIYESNSLKAGKYLSAPTGINEMTINVNVKSSAPPVINYSFNFMDATANMTSNFNNQNFEVGQNPRIGLNAETGFYFNQVPQLIFQDSWGNENETFFKTDQTGEYITNYYIDTLESDFDFSSEENDFIINVYNTGTLEIPSEPSFGGYGILQTYQLDSTILKELETADQTQYDLSNYVVSLNRLFINVDDVQNKNIELGKVDTGIKGDYVNVDRQIIDLGSVLIPEKFNNAGDYNNTNLEIFLPFNGFQLLDAEKVINKTIKLIYKVNILNGDTSILIYNVEGEEKTLIYTFNCNVGYSVPYYLTANSQNPELLGSLSMDNKHMLGFTPFILHRYYNPINSIYNKEFEIKEFNNLTGFYKFNDIELNKQGLLKSEYEEIKALLKEGVIF